MTTTTVQLPDDFRGKKFTVYLAIESVNGYAPNGDLAAIKDIVLMVEDGNIDYDNASVIVSGTVQSVNISNIGAGDWYTKNSYLNALLTAIV